MDFQDREGDLLHTERLNHLPNPLVQSQQRPADVKFLNAQGLHADIQRIWMDDDATEGTDQLCDLATKKCDFSSVAGYLRDASAIADSLLMVPMARTYIVPPAGCRSGLAALLVLTTAEHLRRRGSILGR